MKLLFGHVFLALVVFLGAVDPDDDDSLETKFESMKKMSTALARQLMLQQLSIEERVRSDGDSGVKQIRHRHEGTRNYYSGTHSDKVSVLAIHDHSNNDGTVGMGEFIAVLNGVEFRTRHNDYRLVMPHRTSSKYHAVEPIPFPDVPPEVSGKASVSEQVTEMREWFKAFKNQNHTVRDYRKYFKPIVCYLEGGWTTSTNGAVDESFHSDRHFTDAKSWFDLQEKIRFTSYAGRKDNLENFSFLPTTIMNMTEDGVPKFAQWNYRIACSPIKRDIPLNRFRVVDELGPRLARKQTLREFEFTRSARFQLNPYDKDAFHEGYSQYGLLDEIMNEIPGTDNYQGNLTDEAFDLHAFSVAPGTTGKLRADRYHRWFKLQRNGAFGLSTRHRGFADENLFMAMTTQPKVAGMELEHCTSTSRNKKICKYFKQKWTYAIPLEIIYLTPLTKWNPYDIEHKSGIDSKFVEAEGRNGGQTPDKAYNGTYQRLFYRTPVEFFSGDEIGIGAADTTKNSVGVLDKQGNVRLCKASGTRIVFPPMPDVGYIRQRYPIAPVHGEGSAVWKEVEALKDLVLRTKTNGYLLHEPISSGGGSTTEPTRKSIKLQLTIARKNPPGPHTHEITITADEVDFLKRGGSKTYTTTQGAGHNHSVLVRWVGGKWKRFLVEKCDDWPNKGSFVCKDLHNRWLVIMPHSMAN